MQPQWPDNQSTSVELACMCLELSCSYPVVNFLHLKYKNPVLCFLAFHFFPFQITFSAINPYELIQNANFHQFFRNVQKKFVVFKMWKTSILFNFLGIFAPSLQISFLTVNLSWFDMTFKFLIFMEL